MFEATIHKEAEAALNRLQEKHSDLKQRLDKAYAYAVFPSVGRAAVVFGGAYGQGEVYEQGQSVGFATLTQMTIGVQVGGQTFSELLLFKTRDSLDRFKQRGKIGLTVNASAVIVKAAATATNNVSAIEAVAYSQGGMLLELSIGGSKVMFIPPLNNTPHAGKREDAGQKQFKSKPLSEQQNNQTKNDLDNDRGKNNKHSSWIIRHLEQLPVIGHSSLQDSNRKKSPIDTLKNKATGLVTGAQKELETNRVLHKEVEAALVRVREVYPDLWKSIDQAYGYAVFPVTGRAGLVLGGAFGKGEVFEQKKLSGYAGILQFTIGVQIGGETFTAIVLFDDKDGLERFKRGNINFTANAGAVILKAGAEATTRYKADKVYLFSEGGLLIEAAIGGQKFVFYSAVLTQNQTVEV
jgi:lipid-binding SYLF domain-containing protein